MKIHHTDSDIIDSDQLARVTEILSDAETSTRLSQWENEFCDSLRDRVLEYGERVRISTKQLAIIDRIESKLYEP